ncbi:hypothetical protein PRO82_001320 [Candidatus Protochlamydia amoebophila]|uniref:tetratricopeptide repeat protein n=1 Tax=Candidatus Protochlamydia amoebophila TaxID=362787 RepID=UPI001BD83E2B|nr:tetratricopeptide repeat protein [Candidatus Protochlamydia amoebophila]MBS4164010.1 hypothetical protein [Candidatus Protochlamydia amoebophila]
MQLKFIDGNAPSNYSALCSSMNSKLSQNKIINGKAYILLGSFEKTYPLVRRIWIGIRAFCNSLFSLKVGLFSESVREDWKSFWSGKKCKIIYSSSPPFLPTKNLADQGDTKAQYKLGLMYDEGCGVTQSKQEAFKYFKFAADQGDATAQYKLGDMYDEGSGVTRSEKEAFKYFELAANQGHATAQYKLGIIYGYGRCVTNSEQEAFKYYKLAADQGHADAQYCLGLAYAYGWGVIHS